MKKNISSFYFLGAGRPHVGEEHSALQSINNSFRVIDWTLNAISYLKLKSYFVCGYRADDIKATYPDLNFIDNKEWDNTKSGWSLLTALSNNTHNALVAYSDIVFHESIIKKIYDEEQDVVVTIDTKWRSRYSGRHQNDLSNCEKVCFFENDVNLLGSDIDPNIANAEFIGLVYFSKKAIKELINIRNKIGINNNSLKQADLSSLIELLRVRGFKVSCVDIKGEWAQLNESQDLAKFILGTKAQTLKNLKEVIKLSRIEDQVSFSVKDWNQESPELIKKIQKTLGKKRLIVRSSALSEDSFLSSSAGMYTSILDIDGKNVDDIEKAIKKVIKSYPDKNIYNEVLVQPMLNKVILSGVIFTRGLQDGAPYYSINYDDISGSTESITSGTSQQDKTLVVRRDIDLKNQAIPKNLSNILPAIREIEDLLNYDSLDIEFAITKDHGLHILQVRPITVEHAYKSLKDQDVFNMLNIAEKKFIEKQKSSPFIFGNKALFGVMPDWNPAEIIGTKPGTLATSLYNDLILNEIWAKQRAEYGYRDVRPHPLLVNFAGHPYVDVRASFNSFLPNKLSKKTSTKLINFSLNWLEEHPELHDKVEFEVIPTCFDLDFSRWEERLLCDGQFSKTEVENIKESLLEITNNAITRNHKDFKKIEILEKRFNEIEKQKIAPLQKAFLLIEDIKLYGTLPFSHLARSAFIAISLLRSGVSTGLISSLERDSFLNSIHTVSQDFTHDSIRCANNEIQWDDFVKKYGHLRPGTYDITSPSYKKNPDSYLKPVIEKAKSHKKFQLNDKKEDLWKNVSKKFFDKLNSVGLLGDHEVLEKFFRTAIEGREYAKFAFTRNLSLALDNIEEWGKTNGLDKETLSYVSIEDLKMLQSGTIPSTEIKTWVEGRSNSNKELAKIVKSIELPPLIVNQDNFSIFKYPEMHPNFIGNCSITANCINLENINAPDTKVEGMIVLIPQADPGYDWLFGRNIAGLITMYGGANSHMAIRAAEFGLPAAIGIGESLYRSFSNKSTLELNPQQRIIRIID